MKNVYFFTAMFFCFLNRIVFAEGIDKADIYNKNSDLQWQWANRAIEKYDWKGNERVLDIGCGDGKITAAISNRTPNGDVIGLDISTNMIDFAASMFKYNNLSFMLGNVLSMPFKDQFDLVVSFCALHWVLDQKTALFNIRESLFEDGKALIVIPALSSNNLSIKCEELVNDKKWDSHFLDFNSSKKVYFDQNEYENILKNVGFEIIHIETTYSETKYPNLESFKEWLKPLVPFIGGLSEKLQEEFLIDLVNLLSYEITSDDSIIFPCFRLEALVKKTSLP
ncbi:MAG: putative trans-aconitate 2-methyltransferase [Candidatus Anoxychlamydiales bacterium]|nr:putative trans-aconitate 2-methyltransferase [Candidatus Anoxychlamydiales bacterium]